ncbi:hypothetical protein, partial [Streptomyces scabiei]|uniref:hypothetical protein n=2 Tax=Streptomyces scabiei TaxID=1930 RepID=UPI001F48F704
MRVDAPGDCPGRTGGGRGVVGTARLDVHTGARLSMATRWTHGQRSAPATSRSATTGWTHGQRPTPAASRSATTGSAP